MFFRRSYNLTLRVLVHGYSRDQFAKMLLQVRNPRGKNLLCGRLLARGFRRTWVFGRASASARWLPKGESELVFDELRNRDPPLIGEPFGPL